MDGKKLILLHPLFTFITPLFVHPEINSTAVLL